MAINPMKLFRKHRNKLLAVFMSLLLVGWLGGSALESMMSPDPLNQVIATTRFGDLRRTHQNAVAGVTRILEQMGMPWSAPAGLGSWQGEPLTWVEWALLTQEARDLGFMPQADQAAELLETRGITATQVDRLANRLDVSPKQIYAAAGEFLNVTRAIAALGTAVPVSEAEIRIAGRNVLEKVKVQVVALPASSFVNEEATLTEAELEEQLNEYREQQAGRGMTFGYFLPPRIKAQYIKLDVDMLEAQVRATDASLERKARAYWRENRDTDPAFLRPPPPLPESEPSAAEGDSAEDAEPANEQPIDAAVPEVVPEAADDSVADPTEAEPEPSADGPNPGAGEREQPEEGADQPAEDTEQAEGDEASSAEQPDQLGEAPVEPTEDAAASADETVVSPATQPVPELPAVELPAATKPPSQYYETYPEAREAALGVVRRHAAVAEAGRIAEFVGQRIADPWYDIEPGDDGYKAMPPPTDDLAVDDLDYYERMIAELPAELRYEGVLTTATTDWFSQEDAANVPGLGTAAMDTRDGALSFSRFAFLVQGLAEVPTRGKVDRTMFRSLHQSSSQWLVDGAGNKYLYRVIGVEAARAPDTLDEVREQVVEDLRLKRGLEEAQRRAEALLAEANQVGLLAAWDAQAELQEIVGEDGGHKSAVPFAREQLPVFADFSIPVSVQGVGFVDQAFLARCFELGPASEGKEPRAVILAPELAKVVVVEWESTEPVRRDVYVQQRQGLIQRIQGARQFQLISEWLDPELIRSRNGYTSQN